MTACRVLLNVLHHVDHLVVLQGWLGLLLGTRLWYPFHPAAVQAEDAFTKQMDQVVREIGERGKRGGKPPAEAPVPAPAPGPPPPSGDQGTPGRPSPGAPAAEQAMQNRVVDSPDFGMTGPGGVQCSPSLAETTALVNEIRQAAR